MAVTFAGADADSGRLQLLGVRRAGPAQRRWAAGSSPHPTPPRSCPACPARQRGAASGMRATFLNAGSSLSIGIFFSLMIVGLAGTLPGSAEFRTDSAGRSGGTSPTRSANLPPVGSLFAAFLGYNPIAELLAPYRRPRAAGRQRRCADRQDSSSRI